ncbi:MAG: hypothetical protein K9L87_01370 [Candidatus Omnitrophica bacterium]|nr:hypothetical protein [Candidatus Omnitrophota bacterium]MCF7897394.1 hypothetical protein [Candidatus Omnitrophota bacterium]MCF7909499.1 hypothetical protein [Candidatus Omnitrophota bacterium]
MNQKLIQKTIEIFSRRLGYRISEAEAEEINRDCLEFIKLLIEWQSKKGD